MAPSIGDEGFGGNQAFEPSNGPASDRSGADEAQGPDPVVGAGITLLGIFVMGTAGASDAHYVFDAGVLVAVLGAATFVLCVALSAMKQRKALKESARVPPAPDGPTV